MAKKSQAEPVEPGEGLREIPLSLLIPTPDNNRRINPKSPDIAELALSIGAQGLLQPVLVRPHPELLGSFDLRCGARRFHASALAGLQAIPAIVRHLTDQQALEATITENLQREDLSPLEEADGVQRLLDHGWEVEGIARAIGQTKWWVYSRAQLTKLSPEWVIAIQNPKDESNYHNSLKGVRLWGVAHLEEVARLSRPVQVQVLKHYTENYYHGLPNLKSLRDTISSFTRELAKAPFDITALDLVPSAGACTSCPHRKGANPDLFGMTEVVPAAKDTCLNGTCFEKKSAAHVRQRIRAEKEKDPDVIEVRPAAWSYGVKADFENKEGRYQKVLKTTPGAIPAVVTGKRGGAKVYLKLAQEKEGSIPSKPRTVGDLRKDVLQQRNDRALELCGTAIEKRTWQEVEQAWAKDKEGEPSHWKLIKVAVLVGANSLDGVEPGRTALAKQHGRIQGMSGDELLDALWRCVQGNLMEAFDGFWNKPNPEEYQILCAGAGLDWQAFVDQATEQLPEPAEWAGLKDKQIPPATAKTEQPKTKKRRTS